MPHIQRFISFHAQIIRQHGCRWTQNNDNQFTFALSQRVPARGCTFAAKITTQSDKDDKRRTEPWAASGGTDRCL